MFPTPNGMNNWCETFIMKSFYHDCRLRKQIKRKNKSLINTICNPELHFQDVNVLGPIETKLPRGYHDVLCVLDYYSCWIEAISIKSLTAKNNLYFHENF
ncbi:hypothetical protein CEXT_756151 [Caerostris extrusa]|uniref:Integrase catalytic domain-containing protein n=1 Tax=Caerostris extrusa TaxID=172846 RepID=A0AAV4NI91_CAEEX|nr:hypothetical protein CEXT_756151 [Caerostris extrusa]